MQLDFKENFLINNLRFISFDDQKWFNQTFEKTINNILGPDLSQFLVQEPFFVNFLQEPSDGVLNIEEKEYVEKKLYQQVLFL